MQAPTANGIANGHVEKIHRWHRKHHFCNSFKRSVTNAAVEAKKLRQDPWIILRWITRLITRLMLPGLLILDLFRTVKYLFVVGWQEGVSSAVVNFLLMIEGPLCDFGVLVEKLGNNVLGQYTAADGKPYPKTIIGLLDQEPPALRKSTVALFPSPTPSSRPNGDVCATAAKVIYESEEIVTDVINNVWNNKVVEGGKVKDLVPSLADKERFEFVEWFSYKTKARSGNRDIQTEAMIFRKGAAIVVAFRGTEPFSSVDWATDFYFPWWEIPALGRVHTGFLNALGLGFPGDGPPPGASHGDTQGQNDKLHDFSEYIALCMERFSAVAERSTLTGDVPERKRAYFRDLEKRRKSKKDQFMNAYVLESKYDRKSEELEEQEKGKLAKKFEKRVKKEAPLYWQLRIRLRQLLKGNEKAKLFITGHSLGGALAALFTGLMAAESDGITQKISGLYTFGQPRIGDWTFAWFLHSRLNGPQHRYVRMIYGYDLVPHVPFDTDIFEFKHLGPFHWADPFYHVRIGTFEDQPALSWLRALWNALVELWYNTVWNWFANLFFRGEKYHRAQEGWFQLASRVSALLLPMLAAHSPVNYVNAVRYGMPEGKVRQQPGKAPDGGDVTVATTPVT